MSKARKRFLVVLLLIVSNLATFTLTNFISVTRNDKVLVSKENYDLLTENYEAYSKNDVLKSYIKENFLKDVDDESLKEGELAGIFQALDDPYSGYMDKDEFKDFSEHTGGKFGGIGVVVSPAEDNFITVVSPIEGTPGDRAGIETGDKIIKVDGEEFPASKMDGAVKKMKGKPGTKVTLTILRRKEGKADEVFDLELEREMIKVDTVKSQVLEENIGYIGLSSFNKESDQDFSKALRELEEKNVKGLIVDLRNNPGGLLDVCVNIADEFLDQGEIVYTERRDGTRFYEKSTKGSTELPLVVLINGGSASASEIFSGAIQDRKRGLVVGNTSFGKGVVQTVKGLKDGTGFKLTESEYFLPSGKKINGIGVKPDYEVDIKEGVRRIGLENLKDDSQLQKAIELLK